MRIGINSLLLSISAFSSDLKRIQTPHRSFWNFWADKTFTTSWSDSRVLAHAYHSTILQSLLKANAESNQRFWLQNKWQSWGSALAQLGLVEQANTNTGWFLIGCSHCWLNFKYPVLIFLRSISCLIRIEQKLVEEKIFQLQSMTDSMSNAIICIYKWFVAEKYGMSGLNIQLEQSDPACKYFGQGC